MSSPTNPSLMNMTVVEEFILVGFSFPSDVRSAIFSILLICYLFTMAGNIFIIVLYISSSSLHTPMYFFLCNFAIIDTTLSCTVVPVLLRGFINQSNQISVPLCLLQCYLYYLVGTTEFSLIDVMCYDRYLAICHPLHYSAIMHKRRCVQLVMGSWTASFFLIFPPFILIFRLSFCSSKLNHFFCELGPLLQNSCSYPYFLQPLIFVNCGFLLCSLMVAIISYTLVILAICKISSAEGRKKVFSTCSSHAMVVTLLFGSCIFMYIKPIDHLGGDYDKKVALLFTVVVPLMNPYIYTLRNEAVKEILKGIRNKK